MQISSDILINPGTTIKTIAAKVGAKYATVCNFLKRYQQNGYQLVNRVSDHARKPLKLSLELQQFLKKQDCLQEWASLTLVQRCQRIYSNISIMISPATLSRYYKKLGVRYLRIQKTHKCRFSMQQLMVERYNFVKYLLLQMEVYGREIIFVDETSTFKWDWARATW